MAEEKRKFLGTYFDRDAVIRISQVFRVLAWAVAVIYALDLCVSLGVFALQFLRGFMVGMGFTDQLQQLLYILERPLHGIIYFAVLQALAKGLLILLDVEDNTRRAARK